MTTDEKTDSKKEKDVLVTSARASFDETEVSKRRSIVFKPKDPKQSRELKKQDAFDIKEALLFGWKTFKENFWFFVGLTAIVIILSVFFEFFVERVEESPALIRFIVSLISFIVQTIVSIGMIKIFLAYTDGQESRYGELFSQTHLLFKFVQASVLYGLIVLGGLLLFIVPGVIWAVKYQYFGYFIVDTNAGVIESIKRSAVITNGAKGHLFLFGIVLALMNVVGALVFVVGLLLTIPVSYLATIFVYRRLLAREQTESIK